MPSAFPAERWPEVERLLDALLPMEPDARQAYLDVACADDAALRDEVLQLLAVEAPAAEAFEDTPAELVAPLLAEMQEPTHGTIGPYRIVRELGHGGMGTVYLAEREDVGKQVALKLVRGGLASPEIRQRFLFERRVLARLDHPHIARLLDAGMTDDDTPYFVMEYVEGEPLITYCNRRKLGINERLALFQTVCEAVQYAHQRLVVHRDLKPSNMLVGEAEGELPQVKLLDFGIAKLLEEDEETETLTHTGLHLMTPEYAAPEQVLGEPVTTATDVYALGLLLYQLLTGQPPYRMQGPLHEVSQHILSTLPKKPSTTVWEARTSAAQARTIMAERATTMEQLQRRLRGDLDVICLKALEKEPERRYASAAQLLDDLRRHEAGLPVEARPQTLGYRMQKFVQRHTGPVIAAALAVVVLIAFAIAMTLQQAETAQARDRAEAALARSEAVTEFLTGLFEASDPYQASGDTLTADELLAQGVERAETFSEDPEVKAEVLHTIGVVYERLEQHAQAESLLTQALAIRREVLGEEHADVATSLNQLAWVYRQTGDYDRAESLLRESLAMRRRVLGETHPDVATNLNDLASLLQDQGDYAAAESLYREALAMRRELLGEDAWPVAVTTGNLALLLWQKGDYDAAETLFREALVKQQNLWGNDHLEVATVKTNLALVLEDKGYLVAAESLFMQGLATRKKLLGNDHPDVALSHHNLASLLRKKEDYDASEAHQREALVIWQKWLGEAHPYVGLGKKNLALLYKVRGDYAAAESLYHEALQVLRTRFDAAHPRVQQVYTELGELYEAWGQPKQAAHYQELVQPAVEE